ILLFLPFPIHCGKRCLRIPFHDRNGLVREVRSQGEREELVVTGRKYGEDLVVPAEASEVAPMAGFIESPYRLIEPDRDRTQRTATTLFLCYLMNHVAREQVAFAAAPLHDQI